MERTKRKLFAPFRLPPSRIDPGRVRLDLKKTGFRLLTFLVLILVWHLSARSLGSELVLPTPWSTFKAFLFCLTDMETLANLALTLKRVMLGLGIAMIIGLVLGFAMGYSKTVYNLVDPVIGPLRQVPIMAWVPLTIVWFGLGDGPTLFLICMVGIFPILLNTMAGVKAVPENYYHAARSMGAGRFALFTRVTVPSALPDMITGLRLALSAGWMSVI